GLVAQGDGTAALALAVVFARVLAATALSFAVIQAIAVVAGHGRALGLAGAFVGRALLAFVLASIEAATDVGVVQEKAGLVPGARARCLAPVCGLAGASGDEAAHQPAQGGKGKAVHVASIERRIIHSNPLQSNYRARR